MKINNKKVNHHQVLFLDRIKEISRRRYIKYLGLGILSITAATIGTLYFTRFRVTSTSNDNTSTSTIKRQLTVGSFFVYSIKSEDKSFTVIEEIVDKEFIQGHECWKIFRKYSNQEYKEEEVFWVDTKNGLLIRTVREESYFKPTSKRIRWLDMQDLFVTYFVEVIEYNYIKNSALKKNIVIDEKDKSYTHVETLDIERIQYHIIPKSLTKGEYYFGTEVADIEVTKLSIGNFLCYKIKDMPIQNISRTMWYSVELGILIKQEIWNLQKMSQQETVELIDMRTNEKNSSTTRIVN